jgi:hypothetical protein
MLKFKLWKAVACLAVLVAGAGRGEAANYKLSDLLTGGTIVNGDKEFYNFHNFSESGNVTAIGAENFYLTTIEQPNRNWAGEPLPTGWTLPAGCKEFCRTEYGLRISADVDLLGASQNYNMGLDFQVRVLNPDCKIYANELEVTGNVTNGEIDISEGVTAGLVTLANKGAYIHDPGADNLVDREYFVSSVTGLPVCVDNLHVSLGLQLKTLATGGSASFEHSDIYFAQAGVPEPSTYALLLLGSAGVGLMVRRKRA